MKKNKKTLKQEPTIDHWLAEILPEIIKILGLGTLNVSFCKMNRPMENPEVFGANTAVFSVRYDKPYKRVYLNYYPMAIQMFKEGRMYDLFSGITHEVAHILTSPLSDFACDRHATRREIATADEELTESVGILLRKLIQETKPEIMEKALNKGRISIKKLDI